MSESSRLGHRATVFDEDDVIHLLKGRSWTVWAIKLLLRNAKADIGRHLTWVKFTIMAHGILKRGMH